MPCCALDCDDCQVRDRATCTALSNAARGDLAKFGHCRHLKRGETLFVAGDDNTYCCNLIEGILKVSKFDQDGTEHVLSIIQPAGFAGDIFEPVARHDVIAVTNCTVCMIPRMHFEEAMRRFPEFGCRLCQSSSQELIESRSLLAAVTSPSAMRRVSRYILALAKNTRADRSCEFDLMLTRGEIGSMLGLTIGSVSRQLTKLEADGVISRKGLRGIEVRDPARLREIATGCVG